MEEKNINTPENDHAELPDKGQKPQEIENNIPIAAEEVTESIQAEIPSACIEENKAFEATPPALDEPSTHAYRWDYTEQSVYDKIQTEHKESKGLRNFAIILSAAFVLAIALLIGVLALGGNSTSFGGQSLDALYKECYPSYVAISVVSDLGVSGAGSGIVMTEDGFITTNYHVVEDAKTITVILYDGTRVDAEYVDGDELNDIAILKVAKKGLKPAVIGRSAEVRVGDQVMAIGTPYSINYRGTMTSGYISAVDRQYAAENENGTVNKVVTLLQTDTSVNPGNSGGPLFNMDGEVVGIVSMKIAGSEYEGLGFAIPIDGVIDMLNDIIKNGELTISNSGNAFEGASLGISGYDVVKDTKYWISGDSHFIVTEDEYGNEFVNYRNAFGVLTVIPVSDTETLAQYGISEHERYTAPATGVRIISTFEGFDAARQLKIDDIIMSANGVDCSQMTSLRQVIANSRVGDKLVCEVYRNGKTISVTVELGRSAAME